MATAPSMVMLSSPTSPSPLSSPTTYKIKRKPPPKIELSERYPPPDPSDPFLPLSVLRDRFSATSSSQHQKEDSPVTSLHPISSPALPPRSRYRPRSQATFHVVTHTDADTDSLSFPVSKSPNTSSKITLLPPHDDNNYDDEHDDTLSILSTTASSLGRRSNRNIHGDHKQPLGTINPYAVVAGGRLGSGINTEGFSMMGFDLDRCHAISPDPLPPNSPSNEAQALPILSYNSSPISSRNFSGGAEAAESPRSPTGSTRIARLFNRKDREASTSKRKIPSLDDRDASVSVSMSSASGSSSGFKDSVVVVTPAGEDSALLGGNSLLLSTSSPKQLDPVVHPSQPNTPLRRTRRISGTSVASSSAYNSPTSSPTRVGFDRDSSTIASVGSIGSLAQLAHFHLRAGSGSDVGAGVGVGGSGSGSFRRLSPLVSGFSNENENEIIPGPKDGDLVAVVEGDGDRKDERKQENKVKAKSEEKEKQKQKAKRKHKRTSLPARNLPTFREVHSESELAPRGGWRYFSDVDESMDESQSDFYDVGDSDHAGASASLEIWKFRARRYDKNGKKWSTTTTTVTTAATSSKDATTSVMTTPSLDTFSRSSPSSSSGSSSSGFSASASSSSGSSSGSSYISTPNSTPRSSTSTSISASSYHSFKSSTTSYPEPAIPPGLARADPPRLLSISVPHSPTHLEPESEAESTAKPSILVSTSTPTSPTSPWSGRRIFSDSAVPELARYLSSDDVTLHGAGTGDVVASSSSRAGAGGEGGKRQSESKFKLGVKKILKALKRENEVKESGVSGQGQVSSIMKVEEPLSLSSVHLEQRQSDTVRDESYNNSDAIRANAVDNNDNVSTSPFPLSSLHAVGTSAQQRRPSVSSSSISAGSAIAVDLHMKKDDHVDHFDSYSSSGQGDETLVQDDVAKADADKALPLADVRLNDGGCNDNGDNEDFDMIIVDEGNAWERCGPSRMSTIESEVEFDAEQSEKHRSQTPTPEDIEEDARLFHYHYRSLSSRRRGVLNRRVALDDVFA